MNQAHPQSSPTPTPTRTDTLTDICLRCPQVDVRVQWLGPLPIQRAVQGHRQHWAKVMPVYTREPDACPGHGILEVRPQQEVAAGIVPAHTVYGLRQVVAGALLGRACVGGGRGGCLRALRRCRRGRGQWQGRTEMWSRPIQCAHNKSTQVILYTHTHTNTRTHTWCRSHAKELLQPQDTKQYRLHSAAGFPQSGSAAPLLPHTTAAPQLTQRSHHRCPCQCGHKLQAIWGLHYHGVRLEVGPVWPSHLHSLGSHQVPEGLPLQLGLGRRGRCAWSARRDAVHGVSKLGPQALQRRCALLGGLRHGGQAGSCEGGTGRWCAV